MNRKNVALFAVLVLAAVLVVAGFNMLGKRKETPVPAEPAAVETPVEEPEKTEEPEPQNQVQTRQRPQRQRAQNDDFASDINRIAPMQGDLPTQEEAVDFAYNVLDRYRNGTPEEQERIRAGAERTANLLNGISANADRIVENMNDEQRQRLVGRISNSQELLSAIQQEMADSVSEDEIRTFGGVYMSLRNLNNSLLNAAR
jgi:hypothetical protein